MTEVCNLISDEDITPKVSSDEVDVILDEIYGLKECSIKRLQGYDDQNFHIVPKVSENAFIKTLWPHGYVLKIMNSLDSKKDELCEGQNSLLLFLQENNIPSPVLVQTKSGRYYVKERLPKKRACHHKHVFLEVQKEHIVRLLRFQPGVVLKNIPKSYSLMYQLGVFLAKLDEVLKKFDHPVYKKHHSTWHLQSVAEILPVTHVIKCPKRKELVEIIVENFIEKVMSKVDDFEKGMIHGDFNEHNVLMSQAQNGDWQISAVLDFGDSHLSCYLFELAIALCYMMFECKSYNLDPITGGGHLLAGYLRNAPNFHVNFDLLKLCICARICQSLTLGLKTYSVHPENSYVLDSQEMGWPLLEELWDIPENKLVGKWMSVINYYNRRGFPSLPTPNEAQY